MFCLDDRGVFLNSMRSEYALVLTQLAVSPTTLCRSILSGLDASFIRDETLRKKLRAECVLRCNRALALLDLPALSERDGDGVDPTRR